MRKRDREKRGRERKRCRGERKRERGRGERKRGRGRRGRGREEEGGREKVSPHTSSHTLSEFLGGKYNTYSDQYTQYLTVPPAFSILLLSSN